MSQLGFSEATFDYFEQAQEHQDDAEWASSHRFDYEKHVVVPFTHLIFLMKESLAPHLPGIEFSTKRIVKPVRRRVEGLEEPLVRTKTTAFFSETPTSRFESNPGTYISLGADAGDNVYGVGLYDVSSRQMKLLRWAIMEDPGAASACFTNSSIKKHWGGLSGERFQRFPKDFAETAPGAEFLWHKQFLLSKSLTRSSLTRNDFIETAVNDLIAATPFLQWLRAVVGVYRKEAQ